jgi:uncharacterized protein (TIGR00725 family)
MANQKIIAVIGGSQCSPQEAQIAEKVGRELARRGAILVCGGKGGIMEAACRGAQAESGMTIGILPGEIRQEANPYVQIPIVTGIGHARNLAVAKSAQAVIAIGGGFGTLSEIAFALLSDIPVIGLGTWSLSKDGHQDNSIVIAEDPIEAVDKALALSST